MNRFNLLVFFLLSFSLHAMQKTRVLSQCQLNEAVFAALSTKNVMPDETARQIIDALAKGAQIDARDRGPLSLTPLMMAVTEGMDPLVIKVLLEHGADRSLQTPVKLTAEELAIHYHYDGLAALIREWRATSDKPATDMITCKSLPGFETNDGSNGLASVLCTANALQMEDIKASMLLRRNAPCQYREIMDLLDAKEPIFLSEGTPQLRAISKWILELDKARLANERNMHTHATKTPAEIRHAIMDLLLSKATTNFIPTDINLLLFLGFVTADLELARFALFLGANPHISLSSIAESYQSSREIHSTAPLSAALECQQEDISPQIKELLAQWNEFRKRDCRVEEGNRALQKTIHPRTQLSFWPFDVIVAISSLLAFCAIIDAGSSSGDSKVFSQALASSAVICNVAFILVKWFLKSRINATQTLGHQAARISQHMPGY